MSIHRLVILQTIFTLFATVRSLRHRQTKPPDYTGDFCDTSGCNYIFATVRHFSHSPPRFWHYLPLFATVRHFSHPPTILTIFPLFANVRHFSHPRPTILTLFATIRSLRHRQTKPPDYTGDFVTQPAATIYSLLFATFRIPQQFWHLFPLFADVRHFSHPPPPRTILTLFATIRSLRHNRQNRRTIPGILWHVRLQLTIRYYSPLFQFPFPPILILFATIRYCSPLFQFPFPPILILFATIRYCSPLFAFLPNCGNICH